MLGLREKSYIHKRADLPKVQQESTSGRLISRASVLLFQ